MKYSLCLTALAFCVTETVAFPSHMFDLSTSEEEKRTTAGITASIEADAKRRRAGIPIAQGFSASQQYVSMTGDHVFVPPGPKDLRGPCPDLNAMENHGYIPHNGVATITESIQGTYYVFDMGTDLAAFLTVYGAVFDGGDLTSWSISGPPTTGVLSPIGLLGTPQGISGSHNKYEADVSPTRPDFGNNYQVILSQFEQMYSQPLGPDGYDFSSLTPFSASRLQQSIENNPYFFNGPLSSILVQPQNTHSSTASCLINGNEHILDNWYKRAIGDEYTIPYFNLDLVAAALKYPQFLDVGGNTGKINSFIGVDLQSLTGGINDLQTLDQDDNAACFAFLFSQQAAPDLLKGLLSSLTQPFSQINDAPGKVFSELSCPQLESIDTSQFSNYPGAEGAY